MDGTTRAAKLAQELAAVRGRVADTGARIFQGWQPLLVDPRFADSARNLAAYLALRQIDIAALQPQLSAMGLSSLGRAEAHVMASLDATLAALLAISTGTAQRFPDPQLFREGAALIAQRRDALFGPGQDDSATRIMVTLPSEAADDPQVIAGIVAAGADCLRINSAHDSQAVWQRMLDHAAAAARAAGRAIPVDIDLSGPKQRIAAVSPGKAKRLAAGDKFTLTLAPGAGKTPRLVLDEPPLYDALTEGGEIWLDDGKLRAVVTARARDHAVCQVTSAPAKGWKPKPEKGISLIGVDLDLPGLTADDLQALPFVVAHADLIAYSFVQTVEDVTALLDRIEALSPDRTPPLVLKIETARALRNLPDLIVTAGGRAPVAVMIARGDLAVEIGFERLSEIQEEILWICEAAHVPVIWATQVLEGLVKEGHATRAETTDAAMSQRAECVMLNKGPHVTEGVVFLRDILGRMGRHTAKKAERMGPLKLWSAG